MSDIGQRIGAAGNQASNVLTGVGRLYLEGHVSLEQISKLHGDLTVEFARNMDTIQTSGLLAQAFEGTVQAPPQEAQQAFQGQQSQPGQGFTPANVQVAQQQAPSNVVPGPFDGGQPPQQPVPQQGQSFQPQVPQAPGTAQGGDKVTLLWQDYFNNPSGFYDNRNDKRNPNSPDFKRKSDGEGLWLTGKYGNAPDWVFQRLGYATQ